MDIFLLGLLFCLSSFMETVWAAVEMQTREQSAVWAAVEMQTREQAFIVNIGETRVLRCQFRADNFNLFDNPVVWLKTQESERVQVNLMKNLERPFLNAGRRFDVNFVPQPPLYHMDLTISDMLQEDSGNYTCEVRGPDATVLRSVTHFVSVRVPVQRLYITTSNETRESERVITFTQGNDNIFKCVAIGGYPPPVMRVYLACSFHPSMTERLQITDQLQWGQMPKLSGKKGLRNITYYSFRLSLEFQAEPAYDGCEVTCAVNIPGVEDNPLFRGSVFTVLRVRYAPIIKCFNTTASVGEYQVSMTCVIESNPPIESSYFVIDDYEGTTVTKNDVVDEYWTMVQDDRDGSYKASLYLRRVYEKSFKTYTIIAKNTVGITSHAVSLIKKVIPTHPPPVYGQHTVPPDPMSDRIRSGATSHLLNSSAAFLALSFTTLAFMLSNLLPIL